MLTDWGHMGDLRTTINHGSVSCLKLLSAREPAREQHLCARTCCGASETQFHTLDEEALPWGTCFPAFPPAGREPQPTCIPLPGGSWSLGLWTWRQPMSSEASWVPVWARRAGNARRGPWSAGRVGSTTTVAAFEANQVWCLTSWFSMGLQPEFLLVSCKGAIWLVMSNNFLFWRLICWKICAADVKSWIFNAFCCCTLFFSYRKQGGQKSTL